jgi:hypothetical protein
VHVAIGGSLTGRSRRVIRGDRRAAATAPIAEERRPIRYPVTPDGRYFVVRGRLWRCADPRLPEAERARLVRELMAARRAVGAARRAADPVAERAARAAVDAAKRALGERGPAWWADGAPDYTRRTVARTPYASWYRELGAADVEPER